MASDGTGEERLYQCGRCRKEFGRLDHLNRHLRTRESQFQWLVQCPAICLLEGLVML
jgi:DNA-directed RNA polymerase subunit RPC12/RpoP